MTRLTKKQKAARARKCIPLLAIGDGEFTRNLGYARVSTDDQVLDVQTAALKAAGCHHIFSETVSAVACKRPKFRLLKKFAEAGDTIIVHAFSRIARDVKDLLIFVDDLKARGISLISITEPHIHPFTTAGRMMLEVTGAIDEHERNRVKDRTKAAMRLKMAEGMYIGRPPVVTETVAAKIKKEYAYNSCADLARKYGVSKSTIYKCANA